MRILATAGGTVCKDKNSRDLAAGKHQISFRLLRMVIYPLLLVKQHVTQAEQTLGMRDYREALRQQNITFHFLR